VYIKLPIEQFVYLTERRLWIHTGPRAHNLLFAKDYGMFFVFLTVKYCYFTPYPGRADFKA